ncbi:MAG: ECF-type sigma factor [Casimicrobiaceae bacterium]|nr:ECF-type sigma factor [Casimicrobiaceae bacterium]MDW8312338.1 ECF-type sigma factor [Burkholderiales bacterium]
MNPTPTLLVQRAAQGDVEAMRALFATLYPDIKRLARSRLAQAGGVTGLNATALVHEGFLRMAEREGLEGQTRLQFLAYVGKVLRSIVIDYVRSRDAEKRGGGVTLLTLTAADGVPAPWMDVEDLVAFDEALERLRELDERLYQVVELHVFSGLTLSEVASEIGVNLRTVNRDLLKARTLLARLLGHGQDQAKER